VAQQQLHGAQILRATIDQRRLRPPQCMCALGSRVEADFLHPLMHNPRILPCR
jgi:hypothetical protein